jgi:hypothetical protein
VTGGPYVLGDITADEKGLRMRRILAVVPMLLISFMSVPAASGTPSHRCANAAVPGAEFTVTACLDDLTTNGTVATGHTDPADYAGLTAPGTVTPSGVPGVQVDGYFPDNSTDNNEHGWHHDSQFVLRMPTHWNGGLVVAGPPATRKQYSNDQIISDQVLAKGYAYAATDKGNSGATPFDADRFPGDAIMEWHFRMTQLTVAAKAALARHYGHLPQRTYAAGLSAGGYLVRWQLEHEPELYTGGLDWNAFGFNKGGPNALTTFPPALRAYPHYAKGEEAGHAAMLAAGYPAGSEPGWAVSYPQWDTLDRLLREELDPTYDGDAKAGTPFCPEGTGPGCDTDYDYATRPASVHQAVERVSLTGDIKRPLVSIQGTLDTIVPPSLYGDYYHHLVVKAGRGNLQRYSYVAGGTHTDGIAAVAPGTFRPMLPSFVAAFAALEQWTGAHRH